MTIPATCGDLYSYVVSLKLNYEQCSRMNDSKSEVLKLFEKQKAN